MQWLQNIYLVWPDLYQDSKENTYLVEKKHLLSEDSWVLRNCVITNEREKETEIRERHKILHLSELPVPLTTIPPTCTQDCGGGPWQLVPSTYTLFCYRPTQEHTTTRLRNGQNMPVTSRRTSSPWRRKRSMSTREDRTTGSKQCGNATTMWSNTWGEGWWCKIGVSISNWLHVLVYPYLNNDTDSFGLEVT